MVGDTTLSEVNAQLDSLFASWKSGDVPKKDIKQVQQPGKNVVYLIDRPGSAQSVIFTAQLAPPRNSPDAVAIQIVNDLFGGQFSSRLNMNLREDKHWSYGVQSMLLSARGQRPYLSISPVQTDKTKESLSEVVKEFRGFVGDKPIGEDELHDMQTNDTLSLPGLFESSSQLAQAYQTILSFNLPEDYYNTYTQKAMSLSPGDANSLAKQIIQPDHLIYVVVGDMSKVESGIRELNIGEVRKIDADGKPLPQN
jgi:zinc protease